MGAASQQWRRWDWLAVAILAGAAFAWLQSAPKFSDPDAFYHAALVAPAVAPHPLQALPQAWFTQLRDAYVDHHLLYHITLWPFVALFGTAAGLKVANILFAAAAVAVFYAVGKKLGLRHMWVYTLLLFTSGSWLYRLGLIKATPLSLIVVLVGLLLYHRRQVLALGALAWVFVYLYGGFALLPGMVTFLVVADWFIARKQGAAGAPPRWPLLAAVWGGTLLGIVLTPNFPTNLSLYYAQLVSIGLVNYAPVIGVGGEWYPASLSSLLSGAGVPLILTVIATPLAFIDLKGGSRWKMSLALLNFVLFIFTVKSRRYVEYFAPISLIAGGLILQPYLQRFPWRTFGRWFRQQGGAWRKVVGAAAAVVFLSGSLAGIRSLAWTQRALTHGFPQAGFTDACRWMSQNLPSGTLVFNANWGEWTLLFDCAPQYRYIAGLDPTFMYRRYPELARSYQAISRGEVGGDELLRVITQDFGAQYVFLTSNNTDTKERLDELPAAQLVFSGENTYIYYIDK